MEKGHYGEYSGNAKHSRVTASNYKASERDDAAHIDYLKRDVLYDNYHSHSDAAMTADEKHISKLAGDMKYDKRHHGMSRESSPFSRIPTQAEEKQMNDMLFAAGDTNSESGKAMVAKIKAMEDRIASQERTGQIINPVPEEFDKNSSELKYMPIEDDMKRGMSRESSELKYMPIEDDMKRGMSRKGSKPDYIDIDGDGNKKESMKEASDGMSRKSRSERLRGKAVKASERSGEGQGGYDYENPRVMNMLNKAKMLDERGGQPMYDMKGAKKGRDIGRFLVDEYDNEKRDEEMNRMMDERGGMSRDSYGMERKSCGTKYTGVSRYSSPAAFMGIKRPGRCTPFPNSDCEPGTPQYNLAKRLKPGGDLYKGKKK